MNIADYFIIKSVFGNVIHAEMKGEWTNEVTEAIGSEFISQFTEAMESLVEKKWKFIVLADLSNFIPIGEKTVEVLSKSMIKAKSSPYFYKAVEVLSGKLSKSEVAEAAKKTGEDNFRVVVGSMKEANMAIKDVKNEMRGLV